jgi:hypothetical protein
LVFVLPSILYAADKESKGNDTQNAHGIMKDFIRINESFSTKINKAAEKLDKNISPETPGEVNKNESFLYLVLGADFNDHGDITGNYRFGGQLRLPRFEKYWKVKFANQDEKRDRGQGAMTRRQRTRNAKDDLFLGVSFAKQWSGLDFSYRPQIAYHNGFGLDHSLEAETKYEYGQFSLVPSLQFFADHGDGTGASGTLGFVLWLYKRYIDFEQGNEARFLILASSLNENHFIGFKYIPTDRLDFTLHYFRSWENGKEDYQLSAYGVYLITNYQIYKNILGIQAKPYAVHERTENFKQTNGIVVNFTITF